MIQRVKDDPFIPASFGGNRPGMQAGEAIDDYDTAKRVWLEARWDAVRGAETLAELGVHKQLSNRLLEPFMWHTVIISGTRWKNFFAQRCHPDAQPEMQTIANMMLAAYKASKPNELTEGNWHMPYVEEEDIADHPIPLLLQLSVARCARVSYLSHDGQRNPEADLALFKKLYEARPPHASPFEHVAQAVRDSEPNEYKNFDSGWIQFRHFVPNEYSL